MESSHHSEVTSLADIRTTSFLLSNLHCPSCVTSIEDTLFDLQPKPLQVSPSIVTSWVTVRHWPSLEVSRIQDALEEAGFDVCSITRRGVARDTTSKQIRNAERPMSTGYFNFRPKSYIPKSSDDLERDYEALRKKHLSVCKMCQDGEEHELSSSSSASQALGQSEKDHNIPQTSTISVDPFVVIDDLERKQDQWRASLFIGGMTCASCSNAITKALEELDFVKKVSINLIGNSGSVDFTGKDNVRKIVEEIEDIGYVATLDSVVDLNEVAPPERIRTIEIQVAGMHCDLCPGRILRSIDVFHDLVTVDKPLSRDDPILQINYVPRAPDFTIRQIIATMSDVDPELSITIYHPPSIEERSRKLHAQQRHRLLLRLALSVVIAIPTFVIGIVYMSLVPSTDSGHQYLSANLTPGVSRAQWALFIMATPVYFLAADVFHRRAIKEIRSNWRRGSKTPILQRFYRFGSMNMLMSLGTSIAYISSIAQLIAASVTHPDMTNDSSFYFDSVVFLTMFLLIGRLIEAYSKSRTGDAVTMLGKLRPTEALLVNGESQIKVNVDLLDFGDVVRVLNGASPPSDGTITDATTTFDESSLTGESKLVQKFIGDEVYSGTVNKGSPVSIKITGVAGTSMLDQIVAAVREGQTRRAPIEKIADTLTSYFVPAVTLVAILTWIIWLALGLSGALPQDYLDVSSGGWVAWSLQFAIAVFVVACPCGLALAAPTALFVGGGLAAQHGILVKGGGEAFEKASRLDCIVFDKTGTLTLGGEPVVTDCTVLPSSTSENDSPAEGVSQALDESKLFSAIQALEGNSSHPVAKAIVAFCKTRTLDRVEVDHIEEIAGKGMKGEFKTKDNSTRKIIIGNESLMSEHGVKIDAQSINNLQAWKSQGKSVALIATQQSTVPWVLSAILSISDPIRPEAPTIIQALQSRGLAVWMLSGDNVTTAQAVGAQLGIAAGNIIAGVLPSEKADKIRYLQRSLKSRDGTSSESTQTRATIAMVGDGINDSPALTSADVGIAVGSGSDIAISAAEFVLVSSNLHTLLTMLDLSRVVFRRIKFNFAWALVYNMIALPVAAGALYPIVSRGSHVRLDPVWASLAMAASSVSVVCSSLALRSGVPGIGFRPRREAVVVN